LNRYRPEDSQEEAPVSISKSSYSLSLSVDLNAKSDLLEVSSPSHKIVSSMDGTSADIQLDGAQLNSDFVLVFRV
jgi:hypothetical protein